MCQISTNILLSIIFSTFYKFYFIIRVGPMLVYSYSLLGSKGLALPGADPGLKKGGGAMGSGARCQDFFGQFSRHLKNLGKKGVGVHPPPLWIRVCVIRDVGLLGSSEHRHDEIVDLYRPVFGK